MIVALQPTVRYVLILCGALYHFSSILVSTTSPDPTPWLVNQLGQRVYSSYQQFAYLRNAYHFYSPEPGPASLLFTLVTYEYDTIDQLRRQRRKQSELTEDQLSLLPKDGKS